MSDSPVLGTYRAVVVNNNDPQFAARVTLKIPQVLGDAVSNWAVPSVPTSKVPSPGDLLWVSFEGGDVAAPVYTPPGLRELTEAIDGLEGTEFVGSPPKAPAGLTLSTNTTVSPEGITTAIVGATWAAPTENQDGTAPIKKLTGYRIQYSLDGVQWTGGAFTDETSWLFTGLALSATVRVRVQALSSISGPGLWSPEQTVTTGGAAGATVPSTPTATGVVNGINVTWNGKNSGGAGMPAQFSHVEIERSLTNTFDSPSIVGTLKAQGTFYDKSATNGTSFYYRLIGVTLSAARSAPSGSASATGRPTNSGDLATALNATLGQKLYDTGDDVTAWANTRTATPGTLTSVVSTAADTGGFVLRAVGACDLVREGANGPLIPFDPNVTYRVTGRVRQTVAGADTAQQKCYIGVTGYAADGVTKVNKVGSNTNGSQFYVASNGTNLTAGGGWQTFTGYVKGRDAAPTGTAAPSPTSPGKVHTNVKYIRPLCYVNSSGGTGTAEIDLITVEVVETGAVGGSNLTVDALNGKTITGSLIRTAASGARWEIASDVVVDPEGQMGSWQPNTLYGFSGFTGESSPGQIVVMGNIGETSTNGDYGFLTLSPPQIGTGGLSSDMAEITLFGKTRGNTDPGGIYLKGNVTSDRNVNAPNTMYHGYLADTGIITASTGWSLTDANARRWGPLIQVNFQLTRTGAAIGSNSTGNITNVGMGTVVGGWRPLAETAIMPTRAYGILWGGYINSAGTLALSALPPNVDVNTGDILAGSCLYFCTST